MTCFFFTHVLENCTSVGEIFHGEKKTICLEWSETDSVKKKYFGFFESLLSTSAWF